MALNVRDTGQAQNLPGLANKLRAGIVGRDVRVARRCGWVAERSRDWQIARRTGDGFREQLSCVVDGEVARLPFAR
jgi:hypothetical protein